jgi:hypothetical protein
MAQYLSKLQSNISYNTSPDSPDSEKNIRSKLPGYNVFFEFPNCPVPSLKKVTFAAYVKSVTDTFSPSFGQRQIYGRMDPVPVYERTTRTISFDLDIPSNGLSHSRLISDQLNILVANTYPNYQKNGNVNIISSSPLMKILFSNFIMDMKTSDLFVLGYPTTPLTIKHDLNDGSFIRNNGFEAHAKSYSLSFSMNVLHTYTPGFQINDNGIMENPVKILQGRNV